VAVVLQCSQGYHFIENLDEKLEPFGICNIRLFAHFGIVDFDPFHLPLTLQETKNGTSFSVIGRIWKLRIPFHHLWKLSHFKYRDPICTLDLCFHLGQEPFRRPTFSHLDHEDYEFLDDLYLVIIRPSKLFNAEDYGEHLVETDKAFVWTTLFACIHPTRHSFHDLVYLSKSPKPGPTLTFPQPHNGTNIRVQMDILATKIRRQVYWTPRTPLSYVKADRSVRLPYDEQNLRREPDSDFYQFIRELLDRGNLSKSVLAADISSSLYQDFVDMFTFVSDGTHGFNFVTCATSDTFWSVAELFWRPFQPFVWSGLATTLSMTWLLLLLTKGQWKVSANRYYSCILFNLVEVSVNPGKITGQKLGLRCVLGAWVLMSLILTNSYKGLLISYLAVAVPWAPRQEYNYFEEVMDFHFYASVRPSG